MPKNNNNNKESLRVKLTHLPWSRIAYPAGVVSVFVAIFVLFFISYRFFSNVIDRLTVAPITRGEATLRFRLDAYRAIAPFFGFAPTPVPASPAVDRASVVLLVKNAQTNPDRTAIMRKLIEADGFAKASFVNADKQDAQTTTVAGKKGREKEVEVLRALFAKNGLIVAVGASLAAEDENDVVIVIGAY